MMTSSSDLSLMMSSPKIELPPRGFACPKMAAGRADAYLDSGAFAATTGAALGRLTMRFAGLLAPLDAAGATGGAGGLEVLRIGGWREEGDVGDPDGDREGIDAGFAPDLEIIAPGGAVGGLVIGLPDDGTAGREA